MTKTFVHSIIIQIRYYRESRKLSQSSMADALSLGHRTYQRIESGETVPSIEILYRISNLLNLPIDHFVNPGLYLSPEDSFKPTHDVSDFLSNEEVKNSKIFELSNDPQLIRAFENDDIDSLKNISKFYFAEYPFSISDPKWTILNLAAQKLLKIDSLRVSTISGRENIERLGTIWGILVHGKIKYFRANCSSTTINGRLTIESHGIFINAKDNYFIICFLKTSP